MSSVFGFAIDFVFIFILARTRVHSSTASTMNAAMISTPNTGRTTARIMVVELSVEDPTEQKKDMAELVRIIDNNCSTIQLPAIITQEGSGVNYLHVMVCMYV